MMRGDVGPVAARVTPHGVGAPERVAAASLGLRNEKRRDGRQDDDCPHVGTPRNGP